MMTEEQSRPDPHQGQPILVLGLSGGLIGPDDTPRTYTGSLAGTPVFLGCSDIDPHIPQERVGLSDEVLRRLGGEVTMRLYPGMGHTINQGPG